MIECMFLHEGYCLYEKECEYKAENNQCTATEKDLITEEYFMEQKKK